MAETEVDRLLVRIIADSTLLRAEFEKAGRVVGQESRKMSGAATGVSRAWVAAGTALAGAFSVAAITAFSVKTLKLTADLGEQSQQVGVSVEGLQAYRATMLASGVAMEQTDRILTRLNGRIGEAITGNKAAVDAFAAMGVSIDAITKAGGSVEGVLPLVAKGLLEIQNSSERASAANALFGERIGSKIIPALNDLAAKSGDVIAKQKELGQVISEEVSNKADAAMDRMAAAFNRLQVAAAGPLSWIADKMASIIDMTMQGAADIDRMITTGPGSGQISAQELSRFSNRPGASRIIQERARAAGIPFAPKVAPGSASPATGGSGGGAGLVPATVPITPNVDGFYAEELEALRQFGEQRQELLDDFDKRAAELKQANIDAKISAELEGQRRIEAEEKASADRRLQYERELGQARADMARSVWSGVIRLAWSSNKELAAVGKAAAITQATIDGILGVQKALATYPPPINFAMAAAVGALAAANVAQIAGMEKGGRVTAGTPYIVGEKRPELFVPDTAGRIVPNLGGVGGAVNVYQTLNVMPDVNQAARNQVVAMMPQIAAGTIAALSQAQRRGIVAA